MAKKKRITKEDVLKIERSVVRDERVAQGAMDGRFREKVVPNKKRRPDRKKKLDADSE